MVVVFGERAFGRIGAHGGEHAQTRFLHVYYMPLVPLSSFWVTRVVGESVRGFQIRLSPKSVAATYLRMWGPVAVFASLATGAIAGYLVAALVLAATAWAWTSRSLRGEMAIRASDFRLLAFGSRCDPARMTPTFRQSLKTELDERWKKLDSSRSPDDIARFGASSIDEVVLAYGLLTLAAAEGDARSHATAEQILRGAHQPAEGEGPYRAMSPIAAHALFEEVEVSAANATKASAVRSVVEIAAANDELKAKRAAFNNKPPVPWHRGAEVFIPIAFIAAIAVLAWTGPALFGAKSPSSAELANGSLLLRWGFVDVKCDHITATGEFTNGTVASACFIGHRLLPVAGPIPSYADGTSLEGDLHAIDSDEPVRWPDDVRSEPSVYPVYLQMKSPTRSSVTAILCICTIVATGTLGIVRRARRRRDSSS